MRGKFFAGLTRNTFLLTLTSMFADISTEMLYPVLPIFLTEYLRSGGSVVGLVEGVAIAMQNIVQGFSGWIADKFQKRKPVAVAGYLIAAVAKPLIGISTSWWGVFGARALDRLGTGTRSAPRDALIAASAEEKSRGKAFGLEGIGDNFGAFLGPVVAVGLLFVFKVEIRAIFFLAIVPGLLAVLLILLVKERPVTVAAKTKIDNQVRVFPRKYWRYIAVTVIFGLGNISSSFFILQTKGIGVSLLATILIYAFFNLVAAVTSFPAGALSDRFGRKRLLLAGFLIFLLASLGFAVSFNYWLIGGLFILYGLFQGIFRSVGKAFATDFVPAELRASGIGWYNTAVGLSGLLASITAGLIWDHVGHGAVFFYSGGISFIGLMALILVV